jgi:hypothetical protein
MRCSEPRPSTAQEVRRWRIVAPYDFFERRAAVVESLLNDRDRRCGSRGQTRPGDASARHPSNLRIKLALNTFKGGASARRGSRDLHFLTFAIAGPVVETSIFVLHDLR